MKPQLFVLDSNGIVRKAQTTQEFLSFMGDTLEKVLITSRAYNICRVVTAFLGAEPPIAAHRRGGPRIFETRVYGGVVDGTVRYYDSQEKAMAGHKDILRLITISIN